MTRTIRGGRRVSRAQAGGEPYGGWVAAQVLEVRARLEGNPWAQVGAPAIARELSKLGAVVPPERTIEEILERAGATKRQRPGRRASKGIPYPAPAADRSGDVVQVDLVGPRHLGGGVRFHALNQIDVASHHAGIEIVRDRSDRTVLVALHALWGRHGVPGRIQFDNGGPFVSPTGLGEVVRVCLRQGATPVFVAPREPWRNGTIEHFNDTFDKRFFRQERFADVEQLTERAGAFERFHNAHHRYSATGGRARPSRPRRRAGSAPHGRSLSSPPAGPSEARSSSSASSAPTTNSESSAARSRCPTAAPTSTSPPPSTSRSPMMSTTSSSQATKASCSPPAGCRPPPADPHARPRTDAKTAKRRPVGMLTTIRVANIPTGATTTLVGRIQRLTS
jgi:hypothetical protein